MTDTSAGTVDTIFALSPVLAPYLTGGKLKALAVTSEQRVPLLPNVPTLKETGIDYDNTIWYGLLSPAGTPAAVISTLATATKRSAAEPGFIDLLHRLGTTPDGGGPDVLLAQMRRDAAQGRDTARQIPSLVPDAMRKK